jgi:hypothetical protein
MSFVFITVISNDLHMNLMYSICVFFGTVLGYNFLKYYMVFRKGNFISKKYSAILVVSLVVLIGFIATFLLLASVFQIPIIFCGMIVLIYPFLRKYGWLKLLLVCFVITMVTVYIPYKTEKWLFLDYYINLLQRFLFIICLMIPFEIVDSTTDDQSMNTLPQLFGINKTKLFGMLLIIPFIVLEFLKVKLSILVIPVGVLTLLFIHFTSLERNRYYTSFWVESVPLIWLVLLLIFSHSFQNTISFQ